jgi:hypothetical protein
MGDEDIDKALRVVLGPAMKRLERSFESPEAYIEFVADHPAVGPLVHGPDAEHILRYLHHDVRPSPTEMGRFVSSCVLAAIRADGRDVMFHPRLSGAIRDVVSKGVPVDFLWAPRGLFDEKQGLYDDNRLSILKVPGEVAVTLVPDTNHYSIVLSRPGLAPVIDTVLRRLRL